MTGQKYMVLVPRQPTKEMLDDGWYGAHDEDAAAVWRLMVEAWERQLAAETCSHLEVLRTRDEKKETD